MPGVEKLHLEDALEDNPQTRSLVTLFEQDTSMLKKYIHALHSHCEKVVNAQSALADATSALSQHLKYYELESFPLDSDPDSILRTTLKQFSCTLDEVSSWQQACATQLSDGMMFPLNRFIEADLTEISTMGEIFNASHNDLDQAFTKFCKVPQKREADKHRQDANDDVFMAYRKFHQMALHYYANLNALQYKRKIALLEPLLGFVHALKSHYSIGHESLNSPELENFLSNISSSVQEVHAELGEETKHTVELIDSIEMQGHHLYYAEPPPEMPFIPPNTGQSQKRGYLYHRTKFAGMVTRWERAYFYILGGHLMCMCKGEVAGSVILEIDKAVAAQALRNEDRRYVFQVSNGKKTIVLQALNERDRDEWIATVHNVTKDSLGVKDVRPLAGNQQSLKDRSKSMFTDKTSSTRESPDGTRIIRSGSSPISALDNFMLDTPIQFDMFAPTDNEKLSRSLLNDSSTQRINPFDYTSSQLAAEMTKDVESPFCQNFQARFCGSMQVKTDRGEQLIYETIQKIMAARAIHNMFRMCEVHLVISHLSLRIVDPSHQAIYGLYPLQDVSFWTTHKENNRLLGFITRTKIEGGPSTFQCYVFETQVSSEEVCSALTTAANIALKALLEEKNREAEEQLQEQLDNANTSTAEDSTSKTTNENEKFQVLESMQCGSEESKVDIDSNGESEA